MSRRIESYEVFNPYKARQYWKDMRKRWEDAGRMIEKMVSQIEDPTLKQVVAMIIDANAKNRGDYMLVAAGEGFKVEEIELDDDAIDEILAVTDGDTDPLDDAYDWLVNLLKDMPAPFVAWAFGSLALREEVTNAAGQSLKYFAFERIVYSLEEKRLVGIHSQPNFMHPKNVIIPVKFYAD